MGASLLALAKSIYYYYYRNISEENVPSILISCGTRAGDMLKVLFLFLLPIKFGKLRKYNE